MKLRLPVRLLAAVVAAASHVAFLTVASASGAWAVENASVDLTFVDSADAPAIVADGESLAELPSAQSAEEAVVTLSDAGAEKVTAADAALPEENAAAGDSVVVTAPMTAEEVAAVSAAPEVKTVGGTNNATNVTGAKLLAEEAALVAEYNAIMPGAEGTETPAVSYPANNAAATQTAAANLTVPETAVASDNTTTLNLSAAPAAAPQTAALTTETVSGSTGTAGSSSAVSSSYSAPTFMTTGADVSAPRSAPVVFLAGNTGSDTTPSGQVNLGFWDLGADDLNGERPKSITLFGFQGVELTITTTWPGGGLNSGTTTRNLNSTWSNPLDGNILLTTAGTASTNSKGSFISAGNKSADADLTITLSGLTAGATYNVSLISGLNFEGQGNWNKLTTSSTYDTANSGGTAVGSNSISVQNAQDISAWWLKEMVADSEGKITFTIDDVEGYHTAVINAIGISGTVSKYTLIWDGNTNSDWSNSDTDTNWHVPQNDTTHVAFETESDVVFQTTASVTMADSVTAGAIELQYGANLTLTTSAANTLTSTGLSAYGQTLTKNGAGSLTFTGRVTAGGMNINGGSMVIAGGAGSLGTITMGGDDGNATTLKFSLKDGESTSEYSFGTVLMSDEKKDGLKRIEVDSGVTVRGTGDSLNSGYKATIHSGWGVNGGGLNIEGKLITKGTISFDGANGTKVTIKGSGEIETAGLNVSNGVTETIQGGLTITITSDKGIFKRDGASSTLKLDDVTLKAEDVDWELKGSTQTVSGVTYKAVDTVTLLNTGVGTTFHAAENRTITLSKAMGGSGKLVADGGGTVLVKADNTYTGGTEIKGNSTLKTTASAALGSGSVSIAAGSTLEAAGDLTVSGQVSGAGAIHVTDGTLTLSGANTYTGGISISGGTLKTTSTSALGTGSVSIASGSTLEAAGNLNVSGQVSGAGAIHVTDGTTTISAGSNNNYTGTVSVDSGKGLDINATNFGGRISQGDQAGIVMYGSVGGNLAVDGQRLTVTKKANQQMKLLDGSAASVAKVTVEGSGNSNSAWLLADGNSERQDGLYTDIALNGTGDANGLILSQGSSTVHIGELSGTETTAAVRGDWDQGGDRVLVVHQNSNSSFAGKFIQVTDDQSSRVRDIALTKEGSGTLTLTGANSSRSALTVNGGTIDLAGENATWAGAVTVNTGGTLDLSNHTGVSALNGGLTLSGGTLKLAAAENMLTSTGSITLSSGTLDLSRLDLTNGAESYTLATATGELTMGSVDFTLSDSTLKDRYELSVDGSSLVLTYTAAPSDLYWVGGEGGNGTWNTEGSNMVWTDETGSQLAFPAKGTPDVHFVDLGSVDEETYWADYAQVTLDSDVSVGTMYVSSSENRDTYLNIHSEDPYSIQAKKLSVSGSTALSTSVQVKAQSVEIGSDACWRIIGMEELDANISGDGTIYKSGEDRLLLTGDNNEFAGKMIVETGTLAVGSTTALGAETELEIGDGWGDKTTLELIQNVAATAGSLTMYANSTLLFDAGSSLTLGGDFSFADDVSAENTVTFSFGDNFLSSSTKSPVTLVTFGEGASFTEEKLGWISLSGLDEERHASLSLSGDSIILTFDAARELYWGGGSGSWSTDKADTNWLNVADSKLTYFINNDTVSFITRSTSTVGVEEAISAGTVNIGGNANVVLQAAQTTNGTPSVHAAKLNVDGNLTSRISVDADEIAMGTTGHWTVDTTDAGALSIDGAVSGAGTITKSGEGTLTISGSNTGFTGTFTIEKGTVIAHDSKALGNTPNVVLAGGNLSSKEGVTIAPTGNINITSTANGTISADMQVDSGSVLTFNANVNTTITETGVISGEGSICKNGSGTLALTMNNTYTGGLTINQGTVLVSNVNALGGTGSRRVDVNSGGQLVFASSDSGVYTANYIGLDHGSILTFSGTSQLTVGQLNLSAESTMDLSNIKVDHYGSYVLATVGSITGNHLHEHMVQDGVVQFVTMVNLKATQTDTWSLQSDDVVSLRYRNGQLVLDVEEAYTPAYYWKPSDDSEAKGSWNTTDNVWYSNAELTGATKKFANTQGTQSTVANSVYFLDAGEDGVEYIYLDVYQTTGDGVKTSQIYARNIVVAGGRFTNTETGESERSKFYFIGGDSIVDSNIKLDVNRYASFVVRSGTEAYFKNAAVSDGSHDTMLVEKDALVSVSEVDDWGVYDLVNEGEFYVDCDCKGAENLLGHVDNFGVMSIRYEDSGEGYVIAGQIENRNGASLTLSAPFLQADGMGTYGDGVLYNDGVLVFDVSKYGVTKKMISTMPISGDGTFATTGSGASVILYSYVKQSAMELGATETDFYEGVTITDTTTVDEGATAVFSGGGSLGDVILQASGEDQVTIMKFNGKEYVAETVTAGKDSVFDVQNGSTVTIANYNANGATDGTIVMGEGEGCLVVNGVTNADTLKIQGGTATMNGYATTDQLTQSGGKLTLSAGASVDNGTVSNGMLTLADGQVLTLGHVVTETAGTYTLTQSSGSINADALELVTTYDNARYMEVIQTGEGSYSETLYQSGFMEGGMEKVKVFDVQLGAKLEANGMTVTHKGTSGLMTLISGTEEDENAGWAVLDTTEVAYYTYFLRDNYVTAAADGRTDASGVTRKADMVKLSTILDAANKADAVVGDVKVDRTSYNANVADGNFHGTLTVDTSTKAELFDVTEGSRGLINIAAADADGKKVVVLADKDYEGVDGTLKLSGTGVYRIDNRSDLGENVSLLTETADGIDPWLGTVRVTGSSTGLDTTILGAGTVETGDTQTASTIDFNGWSGGFAEGTQETNAHIVLSGDGITSTTAMTIKEGSADLVWNNDVTGSAGRITHNGGEDVSLTMNGDTSGWDGFYVLSAAEVVDNLKFLGGEEVNANLQVGNNNTMNVTYGNTVGTVNGHVAVFNGSDMNLAYTGSEMQIKSDILNYEESGRLSITVGDSEKGTAATFSGHIRGTGASTMHVEDNSAATLATNAALLRVVGDAGSMVTVNEGETLTLTSTDAEKDYSEFHGLKNDGTIGMQADGGDIRLVADADETTFDAGKVVLSGAAGTATIETAVAAEQTATVNISDLKSSESGDQKLVLQNMYGTGEVDYNLDLTDEEGGAQFHGKIRFGTEGAAAASPVGGTTRVVLGSENVAADAVLESVGYGNTADVVVDTDKAKVKGITSEGQDTVGGKVYGTAGVGEGNKQLVITGSDTYSYNGALGENLDVAYTGSGKQTFEGGADGFNGAVTVNNGTSDSGMVQLLNATTVSITELTIGTADQLGVSKDATTGDAKSYGSAVVNTKLTTAEQAVVNANMSLANGAVVSLGSDGTLGNDALSLGGGTLTLGSGMSLGGEAGQNARVTVQTAWDATEGGLGSGNLDLTSHEYRVVLFDDVSSLTLGDTTFTEAVVNTDYIFARDYFSDLGPLADYYVITFTKQQGSAGFEVALEVIPEPTTSTLSLLALAALCARRRRKA